MKGKGKEEERQQDEGVKGMDKKRGKKKGDGKENRKGKDKEEERQQDEEVKGKDEKKNGKVNRRRERRRRRDVGRRGNEGKS